MMEITLTRLDISDKIIAYLNERLTLAELVDWAEDAVAFADLQPDDDVDLLMDILMYLAAADSAAFPLTWDVVLDVLRQLGVSVKVLAEPVP